MSDRLLAHQNCHLGPKWLCRPRGTVLDLASGTWLNDLTSSGPMNPFRKHGISKVTPSHVTPSIFVPSKPVSPRLAALKSAALKSASLKHAAKRSVSLRSAHLKFAPTNCPWVSTARRKFTPSKSILPKFSSSPKINRLPPLPFVSNHFRWLERRNCNASSGFWYPTTNNFLSELKRSLDGGAG